VITCVKLSNITLYQLDVKKISRKYSMIVLTRGIAFVLFGHLPKKACEDNWGEANRRWFFDTIRNYGPLGIIAYRSG
jgi:hypothetical protein